MSVVRPLLSNGDIFNLSCTARDERDSAFKNDTKELVLKEVEAFMKHAKDIDLMGAFEESLKENGGRFGEVELRRYGNWSIYMPLETTYSMYKEGEYLGGAIEEHALTSANHRLGNRTIYLHKLFRDTQILPMLAAHIGSDITVKIKWVSTEDNICGVLANGEEKLLAEFKIFKVVAVYHPFGLTDWQKKVQTKALAFYGLTTEEEAMKKADAEAAKASEEAAVDVEEEYERVERAKEEERWMEYYERVYVPAHRAASAQEAL